MAIREALVYEGQKPTKEELAEIEAAGKRPINFEDIPEMTEDEMAVVAVMAKQKRSARKKKTVSIRLPQDTIDKAKSMLGEGYTSVLGRVLVMAVDHPDILKQCL
ncbi:MAG: BrnA antitoxin family protein [Schwartzia sp.]|nr:BrnA antitoxin family protein [Schwartzia sp. (in: firmicutes)]